MTSSERSARDSLFGESPTLLNELDGYQDYTRRANWNINMVRLLDSDYFQVLRTKMGWAGDVRGARSGGE